MSTGVYVVVRCVVLFIDVISVAMIVRAILSWFIPDGQSGISGFLYVVTEPVIAPIRAICERFGWFQGIPLDIPFFITAISLSLLSMFLETSIGL